MLKSGIREPGYQGLEIGVSEYQGQKMDWRRCSRVIFSMGTAAHIIAGLWIIWRWFSGFIMPAYLTAYAIPRDERIFTTSPQEYRLSLLIRRNFPEDTNILWLPKVSPTVNYYIYPRKIYQQREYTPGEDITLDADFIRSRNIGLIFVDYEHIYPVTLKTAGEVAGTADTQEYPSEKRAAQP